MASSRSALRLSPLKTSAAATHHTKEEEEEPIKTSHSLVGSHQSLER
ncbi:hypothetical protein CCACVL1_26731 [Corchorus capsularis]|uniref:Uncharacterized protein n=1 Tax=Corchorus capsularis TaxID=210143 RepID=A0A1R3GDI9_COCAP|nr:hypothetical protein CCACVL1_26731 [Corchorus capsularis]